MDNNSNPTYYNSLLQGDSGALKRALYKAMGFTDEALGKPLVAVVNSYTNANPGHANLNLLQDQVVRGIEAAGGTAMVFSTIAPCDGIAEGHEGMRYILPARDLITSSIECMVRAHRFDGMVVIPAQLEREVIERAWAKATGEKTTGDAIRNGMSAKEAFARYGIM